MNNLHMNLISKHVQKIDSILIPPQVLREYVGLEINFNKVVLSLKYFFIL